MLSYAIVLLNTDLHSKAVKAGKRMKREDFCRNLKGADLGADLDSEMLEGIYGNYWHTETQNENFKILTFFPLFSNRSHQGFRTKTWPGSCVPSGKSRRNDDQKERKPTVQTASSLRYFQKTSLLLQINGGARRSQKVQGES